MTRPVVALFEFSACGVSLTWSEPAARTVALKAIVDVVKRFLSIPRLGRIELEPRYDPEDRIITPGLEQFVAAAPALVRPDRCFIPNQLRINGEATGFMLTHLDQSTAGFSCELDGPCSDESRDRFYEIVMDVLREYRRAYPDVDVDFGAYSG